MLSDKITINNNWYKKLLAFIGNPIVAILIGLLISIFFTVIGLSRKVPYYYLTAAKPVTKVLIKDIKPAFQNHSIKNLYFVDLVLWNNGDVIIDYSDFVMSKPIVLKAKEDIKILTTNILLKSRADLQFVSTVDHDSLNIVMTGDEAFEQGDGVVFRVFYTTAIVKPIHFFLRSRIKGTSDGFEYKDLVRSSRSVHTLRLVIGWCLITLLILIRTISLFLYKKPIVFRRFELIMLTMASIIWSYYTYEYLYFAVNLEWYKSYL